MGRAWGWESRQDSSAPLGRAGCSSSLSLWGVEGFLSRRLQRRRGQMPGGPCPIPGPQLHRVRVYSAAHGLIRRSSSSIRTDVMPPCSQSSFTCVLCGSELQACPPHTPRVLLASPPATSVRPTRLSPFMTRGPNCAPCFPLSSWWQLNPAGQGWQGRVSRAQLW